MPYTDEERAQIHLEGMKRLQAQKNPAVLRYAQDYNLAQNKIVAPVRPTKAAPRTSTTAGAGIEEFKERLDKYAITSSHAGVQTDSPCIVDGQIAGESSASSTADDNYITTPKKGWGTAEQIALARNVMDSMKNDYRGRKHQMVKDSHTNNDTQGRLAAVPPEFTTTAANLAVKTSAFNTKAYGNPIVKAPFRAVLQSIKTEDNSPGSPTTQIDLATPAADHGAAHSHNRSNVTDQTKDSTSAKSTSEIMAILMKGGDTSGQATTQAVPPATTTADDSATYAALIHGIAKLDRQHEELVTTILHLKSTNNDLLNRVIQLETTVEMYKSLGKYDLAAPFAVIVQYPDESLVKVQTCGGMRINSLLERILDKKSITAGNEVVILTYLGDRLGHLSMVAEHDIKQDAILHLDYQSEQAKCDSRI